MYYSILVVSLGVLVSNVAAVCGVRSVALSHTQYIRCFVFILLLFVHIINSFVLLLFKLLIILIYQKNNEQPLLHCHQCYSIIIKMMSNLSSHCHQCYSIHYQNDEQSLLSFLIVISVIILFYLSQSTKIAN